MSNNRTTIPFLPGYETIPSRRDEGWREEIAGIRLLDNIAKPIEYTITRDLVTRAKHYNLMTPRDKRYKESPSRSNLALLYKVTDTKGKTMFGYSFKTLTDVMRINLSKRQLEERNLFQFTRSPIGAKIEVLEYVMDATKEFLSNRIRHYQEKQNDRCYDVYLDKMKEVGRILKPYRIKRIPQCIMVYRDIDTDKHIVSAMQMDSDRDEEELLEFMMVRQPKLKQLEHIPVFKRVYRKEAEIICDTHLLLVMDMLILQYDAIHRGYNNKLGIVSPELTRDPDLIYRNLFIGCNKDLVKRFLVDNKHYPENFQGFVYALSDRRDPNKKYIGFSRAMGIKKMVTQLYTRALAHREKNKKIHQFLSTVPCFELKTEILSMKTTEELDLERERERMIRNYDSIEKGWNDPGDIKKTKFYLLDHQKA